MQDEHNILKQGETFFYPPKKSFIGLGKVSNLFLFINISQDKRHYFIKSKQRQKFRNQSYRIFIGHLKCVWSG